MSLGTRERWRLQACWTLVCCVYFEGYVCLGTRQGQVKKLFSYVCLGTRQGQVKKLFSFWFFEVVEWCRIRIIEERNDT